MPRRRKQVEATRWTQKLDKDAIRAAMDDASVDAYNEHEQHSGLLAMIEDEVEFPFQAKVVGEMVTVTGMEWPESDSLGLDLVCERQGASYPIDARSVEMVDPLPKGHLRIAAYMAWKASF